MKVVTGYPNYPEGKLHQGYKQRFGLKETVQGIPIFRTPLFVSHSSNALGRIANYLSFGMSAISASRFNKHTDVNYVYATQMTAVIAPFLWWKIRGTPYVLHVQDLWPESITGSGMLDQRTSRIVNRLLNPLIRIAYRNAGAVIGISNRMSSVLLSRGARAEDTFTLYNWAPPVTSGTVEELDSTVSAPVANGSSLKLIYAGNIGVMQDLGTLLEAMHLVRELPVTLSVFGGGVLKEQIQERAATLMLSNVEFFDNISYSEIKKQYRQHDFQVILLKKLDVFELTIPSKFQAGISCGLPVICAVDGELSDLTHQHNIGLVAPAESPSLLAKAIRSAFHSTDSQRVEMRSNSINLYEEQMSFHTGMERLEEILRHASRYNRNLVLH